MDRISNLPDGVLCHILSFLNTKEAALTSILCKRWRNLIAFVPNLDIDDSVNLYSKDNRQLFMDFVDRVLALQGKSPINKFSLHCVVVDSDRIDAWIRNLMLRGVSELELSILWVVKYGYNYCLSPKIFESNKLLKLEICHDVDLCWLDGTVFLPMLKTIVLDSVLLSVYNFEILLHALPALEELVLRSIRWKEWNVPGLIVSSASLKTLTIDSIGCLSYTFDTPSLVNFCYSDYDARDYSVAKMENLLEARISLRVTEDEIKRARLPNNDWLQDIVVLQFANLGNLMNGIRNVRYMKVCADTLEVVSLCCESMPVFNNLKSLTIENNKRRSWQAWQALPAFLRNSPHIETLVLEDLLQHVKHKCGDACDCISREVKGRSLTTCPIKVLKIQECQGTMKELRMIKHFLVYLPCLKEIEIYIKRNGITQLRVPEVSEAIAEMIELNNKLSSCNVQLLVNGCLYKKWTAQ